MSDPKSLILTQEGDITVASFRDASILDAVTIQRIGRELYALVEEDGSRRIILDFADVRFLSSQALGVLLTLRRKADQAKAEVFLAGIRDELARVFKMTNLDKLFQFYEDRTAALAKLGAG